MTLADRTKRSPHTIMPTDQEIAPPSKQPIDSEDKKLWRSFLSDFAPILTATGLVIYFLLSLTYERFYRSLGVRPSDVGLTYANTLTNSVGMILLLGALTFVLVFTTPIGAIFHSGKRRGARIKAAIKRGGWPRYRAYLLGSGQVLALLIGLYWGLDLFTGFGTAAANAVKAGRPVVSPYLGPTTLLAIHADPALIESTLKPGENPGIDSLKGRNLLFLGQANGVAVLYDSNAQTSVLLPTASIVLRISNCATQQSHNALCTNAYGGNYLKIGRS